MAESVDNNLMSTDSLSRSKSTDNIRIITTKPATPLLLPPPQLVTTPSVDNDTSTATTTNSKNSTSSSSDDDNTNNKTKKQRRRQNKTIHSNYIQPSLQPNMPPIIQTPSLNPTQFSVNSADSPRNEEIRKTLTIVPRSNNKDNTKRYTMVNTCNPYQSIPISMQTASIKDESNGFLPMKTKPSLTMDETRLIANDVLTSSEHDDDQKIVEIINITRDDSIELDENMNNNKNKNKYKKPSSNILNIRAGGIPTTPSYPTPLTGPSQPSQPNPIYASPHNISSQSMRYNINNNISLITTTGSVHDSSVPPPSVAPSVSASQISTSYRRSSQFMDNQQHRKRTNKLKFNRTKWSDHGKRVLLNTTIRVDRVCHTLVQTRQRFGVCPTEMRQLSLIVAVIERAMYSYGRQVQEYKEKLRHSRSSRITHSMQTNNNYGYSSITPNLSAYNTQNTQNTQLLLSNHMEPSISAPHYTLEKEQIDIDELIDEHIEVHSDDSVETIGKCTNTSIVTGTTFVRADSPINQIKLARHQQIYNKSRKRFKNIQYSTPPIHAMYNKQHDYKQQRYHQNEQLVWRHPGGVVSLLEILGRVLRSTEEQLVAIGKIASLTDFVQNNKLIWVISIVAGAYIFAVPFRGPIQFILEQCSKVTTWAIGRIAPSGLSAAIVSFINNMTMKNVLFGFIPSSLRNILNGWISYILSCLFGIFNGVQSLTAIESVSFWLNRFRFIILPTLIYVIHKCFIKIYLMRLSKLQNQLNSIILHWQLCMTAITAKNRLDQSLNCRLKRIESYKNKHDYYQRHKSLKRDDSSTSIDIYQWILRLVPPSAHIDACFWYGSNLRLRLLRKLMDVNYAVTSYYYRIFGSSTFFWPMAFPILAYYVLNPHRAACRANEFLANPDIRIIRVFYSLLDSKLARWVTLKVFPKLGLMPPLQTAITFEIRVDDINSWNDQQINNHYDINDDEEQTNIKFHNIDIVRIKIFATKKLNIKPDYIHSGDWNGAEFLNETVPSNLIQQHNHNTIPAHNISLNTDNEHDITTTDIDDIDDDDDDDDDDNNNNIDDETCSLSTNDVLNMGGIDGMSPINPLINKSQQKEGEIKIKITKPQHPQQENGVIFYIHGGGFLGNFCASDLRILSQWSSLTNAPIVEVDYSLIPSKWPTALQECILAYKCLCYGRLGFNARRIAVIGDSNGGGLAVSMILNIIQEGLRVPDVLILTSPILSLRQTQPTTSRLLFNMDPLVPMNLIVQLTKYYLIPTICDDENDPLISPLIAAPDYLLSSFPPTTIVVGGLDPFLDDSIDFAHRLSNNDVNVDVKLKIYKMSPHAFLNFNYILNDVNHAIHLIAECIDQAFLN